LAMEDKAWLYFEGKWLLPLNDVANSFEGNSC
jgi:hypothetical protein